MAVRHHPAAGCRRLVDDRSELVLAELWQVRVRVERQDTARRRDLDAVGTGADELAYDAPQVVRSVDDAARPAGMLRQDGEHGTAQRPGIGMAAGLRDHRDRDAQPRPGDEATFDGRLHTRVGAPSVANRRNAQVEGLAQRLDGVEELQ